MITASAPGKLVLMGEYAVLHGHAAVVASVDVRAVCTRERGPLSIERDEGGLVDAVLEEAGEDVDGSIVVDTAAFRAGNDKYGLGSSAAASVSLLRALLPHIQLDELHVRAQRAHRNFQKGRGSGVDVCASVYGGITRYVRKNADEFVAVRSSILPGVTILPVWTGVSANTRSFLRAVEKAPHLASFIDRLGAASESFQNARNEDALLASVQQASSALEDLGIAADVDIFSEEHADIDEVAQFFGGAAKPSGAGGGDVALAFLPAAQEGLFRREIEEHGYRILPFALGVPGVDVVGDGA